VHIEDKENPKLMNAISSFSSKHKRTHFQHDELRYGVCYSKCIKLHIHLKDDYEKYVTKNGSVGSGDLFEMKRNLLNKLANVCINRDLQDLYGLKADTELDYCIHENYSVEPIERYFALLVLINFIILFLATLYDKYKEHQRVSKYFDRWQSVRRRILSFSVTQNWKNFKTIDSNESSDITRFYAVKIVFMFLFVYNQVYRSIVSIPFANPIHIERVRDCDFVKINGHLF
jgi:hypothetical protein